MAETDNMMSASELFDLSLEIEGLLALVVRREDMVPSEVLPLLNDKAVRFAEGIQALVSQGGFASAAPSSSRTAQERDFVASLPSLPGLFDYDCPSQSDIESMQAVAEADKIYAVSESTQTELDIVPGDVESELQHNAEPALSDAAPNDEPIVAYGGDDTADESVASESADDIEESIKQGECEIVNENVSQQPLQHREPGELRRMFTVNDKFRFRRELFGNSDTEFTDTLNLVEAMRNYNEAEDYFYTDLSWDAEAPEVQEFMAVVNRYFTK